jgi:hypothetical protein
MGTDAGIAYRYGPSAAEIGYRATTVTYEAAGEELRPALGPAGLERPQLRRARRLVRHLVRSVVRRRRMPGDFSSSDRERRLRAGRGAAAKRSSRRSTSAWPACSSSAIAHDVMAVKPEHSWTTYDGVGATTVVPTIGNIDGIRRRASPMDQKPVAVGKCYGRGGWCTNSLAVFANGWLDGRRLQHRAQPACG